MVQFFKQNTQSDLLEKAYGGIESINSVCTKYLST